MSEGTQLLGGVSIVVASIFVLRILSPFLIALFVTAFWRAVDFWTNDREGQEEGHGTLVFVYVWTVMSLVLLGAMGYRLVCQENFESLRWTFVAFAHHVFLVMVLIGGLDAVRTEGPEMEETGWYRQTSVLLFLTCLFGMIKSLVFQFWSAQKSKTAKEDCHQEELIQNGTLV